MPYGFGETNAENDRSALDTDYDRRVVLQDHTCHGWASYPTNKRFVYHLECAKALKEMHGQGGTNATKAKRYPPEVALKHCVEQIIHNDWYQRMILTTAKVKQFLALTPSKMEAVIEKSHAASGVVSDSDDDDEENEEEGNDEGEGNDEDELDEDVGEKNKQEQELGNDMDEGMVECVCNLPIECETPISCDQIECVTPNKWYHPTCVGESDEPMDDNDFW